MSSLGNDPRSIFFFILTENSFVVTNDTQGPQECPHQKNNLVTHINAQHGTKTTSVFLPANGEASWPPLPCSVSLLSGSTVQPENSYSCILKVRGLV